MLFTSVREVLEIKEAGGPGYVQHAFVYILGAKKSLKRSVVKGKTGSSWGKKKKKRNAVPVHGPVEAQIYTPTRWSALTPQPTRALGKEQPVPNEQGLGRARSLSGRSEQHTPLLPLPKTTCDSSDAQPTA